MYMYFQKIVFKTSTEPRFTVILQNKIYMDEFYFILIASTAMDIYHESSNIFQMVDECSKEYAQGEDLNNISGMERVMGGEGSYKIRDIRRIQ